MSGNISGMADISGQYIISCCNPSLVKYMYHASHYFDLKGGK